MHKELRIGLTLEHFLGASISISEHNREIMIDSPPMFGTPSQNNAFSTLPSKFLI